MNILECSRNNDKEKILPMVRCSPKTYLICGCWILVLSLGKGQLSGKREVSQELLKYLNDLFQLPQWWAAKRLGYLHSALSTVYYTTLSPPLNISELSETGSPLGMGYCAKGKSHIVYFSEPIYETAHLALLTHWFIKSTSEKYTLARNLWLKLLWLKVWWRKYIIFDMFVYEELNYQYFPVTLSNKIRKKSLLNIS